MRNSSLITKMKDNGPLVSIVVPCYNSEKFLDETISSILSQSYSNIEVICINDGSTDGTLAILKRYGNKIKLINKHNEGQSIARNVGIQESNGKYIMFIDSDDYYIDKKIIHKCVELMENYDYDFVQFGYLKDNCKVDNSKICNYIWNKMFVNKKDILFNIAKFTDCVEDLDYISRRNFLSCGFINDYGILYRTNLDSLTKSTKLYSIKFLESILISYSRIGIYRNLFAFNKNYYKYLIADRVFSFKKIKQSFWTIIFLLPILKQLTKKYIKKSFKIK